MLKDADEDEVTSETKESLMKYLTVYCSQPVTRYRTW